MWLVFTRGEKPILLRADRISGVEWLEDGCALLVDGVNVNIDNDFADTCDRVLQVTGQEAFDNDGS